VATLALAVTALAAFVPRGMPQGPQLANLREVPFTQVKIADGFFAGRRAQNRKVTLEHALRQLEETGTLPNFDLAAAGAREGFQGFVYQDSDAYKALEAVAMALADAPDPELDAKLDGIIARIGKSQQPDGYLNSWFTVKEPEKRFLNLRDNHELYCAGHLFEAAVAHFRATGKRNLLDIATKYADLLCNTFGDGPGKRAGYCGHPGPELALVKLADVTGKPEYFALAQYFVNARGSKVFAQERGEDLARYDGTYWLDHVPLRELGAIAGHAVRATYLMSGAVDVAARTRDEALLRMVDRVWRNTIEKNVFVTGGIGPSASNEGFTHDFDLPTGSAYQESCASIGVVMWAWRLNLLYADARYADAVEQALYNAIPAGVQLDGRKFFYVNPLASRGDHHRREWYGCACCPPNLARTFAGLGSYAYATGPDALYVNLYIQGSVRAKIGEAAFELDVVTDYPWQGNVTLTVRCPKPVRASLCLRIPGWCEGASASINREVGQDVISNGYCVLNREWRSGDKVELRLPMTVRRLEADPRAEALRGRIAFARGPIVYCGEQTDQKVPLEELVVPPGADVKMATEPKLLGGVVKLAVDALHCPGQPFPAHTLYRGQPQPKPAPLVLVPYAVWDNRTAGPMAVWFPQSPLPPRGGGPEARAKVSMSFVSGNCDPEGVRDGEEPQRSGDTPPRSTHWWPHKGTTEWIQYDWPTQLRLDGCRIYWFDDTGRGECRLPKQARLSFLDGDQWKPVLLTGDGLPIAADRWCEVKFAPITTRALRLEVGLQPDFAAGVIEWRVHESEDGR
jgi:DUF1680 family protein